MLRTNNKAGLCTLLVIALQRGCAYETHDQEANDVAVTGAALAAEAAAAARADTPVPSIEQQSAEQQKNARKQTPWPSAPRSRPSAQC